MRQTAARLGRQCDQLAHVSATVHRAAAAMVYHCPAGDDLRGAVGTGETRLHQTIADIETLRRLILREAAELETTQREYARFLRGQTTGP
jgi:hypothetical protein